MNKIISKSIFLASIGLLTVLLPGCFKEKSSFDASDIALLKENISKLSSKVINLQSEIADLEVLQNATSSIETSLYIDVDKNTVGKFNAKEHQGFSIIKTAYGSFFVSVKEVQPYLDGFKIIFSIGNPSFATYLNPKITIRWFPEGVKAFKSKESSFDIIGQLNPGCWSEVEVFLPDFQSKFLEEFVMQIDTVKTVELSRYNSYAGPIRTVKV